MAGPLWPAHPTIPWPGGGCQATVTLLFSALHSSGINIGAPGAEGKKWDGREKKERKRKRKKERKEESSFQIIFYFIFEGARLLSIDSRDGENESFSQLYRQFFLKRSHCRNVHEMFASETRSVDKKVFHKLSREYTGNVRKIFLFFFFTEETKRTETFSS